MKISIVLVHYNAQELLDKAILSIYNQKGDYDLEFLITDNSQNYNLDTLNTQNIPYSYFNLEYNAGFSRGVNKGLKNATGEYAIILNQDAYFHESDTLNTLINKIKELPEKTILGCKLIDDTHQFQQSIWIDNPGLKREWKFGPIHYKMNPHWKEKFDTDKEKIHLKSGYVPRINGAFLIIPLNTEIDRAKILFDDDFFLYGEDVEWANRIKKLGFKFYYEKNVQIKHLGSYSSDDTLLKNRQILLSSWLFVRKSKGIFVFITLICLTLFNKKLDRILDRKNSNQNLVVEQNLANVKFLISNYFWNILFLKKTKNGYIAKCYE